MDLHRVGHTAPQMDNRMRATAMLSTALAAPLTISQLTFEFIVSRVFKQETKLVFLRGLNLDWDTLDNTLSARRGLAKVVFMFRDARTSVWVPQDPEGLEAEVEEVKKRVPRLRARGILTFECVEVGLLPLASTLI